MKKSWKSFILGFLTAAILLGLALPAIAAGSTVNWDSVFVGVSIVIDGHKLDPRDVNGNQVDAVIYKGTTYLPVRAVAEALGLDVNWDQDTRTVYLGSGAPVKPEPQPEPEPAAEPEPAEEPEKEPAPAGNEEYLGTYKINKVRGQSVDELYEQMVELYKELYGDELDPEDEAALKEFRDGLQNMLVLELKADGVCVFTYEEESIELAWKVEGEKITLSANGEEIDGTIKDGVISLVMEGETVELKK